MFLEMLDIKRTNNFMRKKVQRSICCGPNVCISQMLFWFVEKSCVFMANICFIGVTLNFLLDACTQ